jgi:S-formylglutathione hydrolase FrmB
MKTKVQLANSYVVFRRKPRDEQSTRGRVANRGSKELSLALLLLLLMPGQTSAQQGRMEQGRITSSALTNNLYGDPATRNYSVYLPASYDTSAKRYPVVYFLHAWSYDESALATRLQPTLDSMIRQRLIGEVIAVCPNAQNKLSGSWYVSSPVIGDYETYIAKDLVGWIDSHYRTLAVRESRGVTGWSAGGYGTMHLALKFPDVFSVAVPQAGLYNSRSQLCDGLERGMASYHPTNLTQVAALPDWRMGALEPLFAGLLPNPQRPSLYTDYVYDWVNNQAVLNASADQRCRQGDIQNGDLPRYLSQPVRLNGIKILHGTADSVIPLTDPRQFTNALGQAGVLFEYQEHSGGHEYRADLALPFLSSHLQDAERYIKPPLLALTLTTNAFQLAFPTQTNVQYTIESAAVLDALGTNWVERAQVTGDLRTAKVTLPFQGGAAFFRVRAANVP